MDASTAAVQANLKQITKFEVKLPPQTLSETAVTEAFGAWAYPKIVSASAAVPVGTSWHAVGLVLGVGLLF
jgi:hypothetical protein